MTSSDKEAVKSQAFSVFKGWDYVCGCQTERGRVFFAKGTKLYQYGNAVYPDENYTGDDVGDYDSTWLTATGYVVGDILLHDAEVYRVLVDHTSGDFDDDLAADLLVLYKGQPITFDYELPWADINQRAKKKRLEAIQVDTRGKAAFTLQVYVDNFYKDLLTDEYIPAVFMEFVAGDALGYGGGDQPYGGGRRLRDERPFDFPVDFKIMKLRLVGSSVEAFQLVTLTILYHMGTYKR